MNVHFIGELIGASDVDLPNLSCHYKVVMDDDAEGQWVLHKGEDENFTQMCANRPAVWNHPLDLSYGTTSVATWPSLLLEQVWSQDDASGLNRLAGYGCLPLPASPGHHPHLEAVLWRPVGGSSLCDRLRSLVLGGGIHHLDDPTALLTAKQAGFALRYRGFGGGWRRAGGEDEEGEVVTETMGTVAISLHVVVSTGAPLLQRHQGNAAAAAEDAAAHGCLSLGAKGIVLASEPRQAPRFTG